MDENKIKEFNVELQALLLKYNVNLQVSHGFQLVPRELPKTDAIPAEKEPE